MAEHVSDLFHIEPQNAVELHHATAGPILHAANSQAQPEAGSFFQKNGDAVSYLPIAGAVERALGEGHVVTLDYGTFVARVTVRVLSANESRVKAEVLDNRTGAPVVYDFFPGVARAEDLTASEDGREMSFRNVTINADRDVQLDRDFRIYNAYGGQYSVRTKPVRAYLTLEKGRALTLVVRVT